MGYNYKKDKIDLEYDVKKFMDNKISEVHVEFDNSMYNALENMKIGKNLHKIRNTKKIVKDAYDNILGDLNNGKKIILIGENYGGAIVNRLLDMFIQDFKKLTDANPNDIVLYNIFVDLKDLYNKFRTHVRKTLYLVLSIALNVIKYKKIYKNILVLIIYTILFIIKIFLPDMM